MAPFGFNHRLIIALVGLLPVVYKVLCFTSVFWCHY